MCYDQACAGATCILAPYSSAVCKQMCTSKHASMSTTPLSEDKCSESGTAAQQKRPGSVLGPGQHHAYAPGEQSLGQQKSVIQNISACANAYNILWKVLNELQHTHFGTTLWLIATATSASSRSRLVCGNGQGNTADVPVSAIHGVESCWKENKATGIQNSGQKHVWERHTALLALRCPQCYKVQSLVRQQHQIDTYTLQCPQQLQDAPAPKHAHCPSRCTEAICCYYKFPVREWDGAKCI